jgi:mycothiol synthase
MNTIRVASEADREAIDVLLDNSRARTGREPLSEFKERARSGGVRGLSTVVESRGSLVGFCQAAWHPGPGGAAGHWAFEAVLEPSEILLGPDLILGCEAELSPADARGERFVWSADATLADALVARGFREARRLERQGVALPLAVEAGIPDGIELRGFRHGRDEMAWIATNNRAFAGHPENGSVTLEEMEGRMALPWFSPDDLLMAWRGDRLAGSCWTKLHPGAVGEIYIIGVEPEEAGIGLGRALVVAAANRLAAVHDCRFLMLYTEDGNTRAQSLYRSLGFVPELVNRQFAFPVESDGLVESVVKQ